MRAEAAAGGVAVDAEDRSRFDQGRARERRSDAAALDALSAALPGAGRSSCDESIEDAEELSPGEYESPPPEEF
ncbi:MAG: hypothetical protein ABI885_30295 [Gammaproteobacteria bacterium]